MPPSILQPALWADPPPPEVDLADWDLIAVYTSAGKDSAAIVAEVAGRAAAAGVLDRVVAVHADLGLMEWPGTRALAEAQARLAGISRFEIVQRAGEDLLDYALRWGYWPSASERWCTSSLKRDPSEALIRRLARPLTPRPGQDRVRVLEVAGMRAEESRARARLAPLRENKRLTTRTREVLRWLPLHTWPTAQVFARGDAAGLPRHPAYALGQSRASCVLCIFLPPDELVRAARARPKLAQFYAAVESAIGHRFRVRLSVAEVCDAAGVPLLPAGVLDPILTARAAGRTPPRVAELMAATGDPVLDPRPDLNRQIDRELALLAARDKAGVGGDADAA